MRQTQILSAASEISLLRRVLADAHESLPEVGLSRRYLCESFSRCLDPYPGDPQSADPISSFGAAAFPALQPGRRVTHTPHLANFVWQHLTGLQSFNALQASGFARYAVRSYHD